MSFTFLTNSPKLEDIHFTEEKTQHEHILEFGSSVTFVLLLEILHRLWPLQYSMSFGTVVKPLKARETSTVQFYRSASARTDKLCFFL